MRGTRHTPRWVANVQAARENGIRVLGSCPRCGANYPQDLDALAMFRGKNYHWSGRRDPCSAPGCDGQIFYIAFGGSQWPWPLAQRARQITTQ